MSEASLYAFASYGLIAGLGFILAGAMSTFFHLLASRPASFHLNRLAPSLRIPGATMLVIAGPAVIMRNAIRGHIIDARRLHWLILSLLIAGAWSFISGIALLHLVHGNWLGF